MNKDQLLDRYARWTERCGTTALRTDLDNARELLSYDAPAPDGLFSGVSVWAIAVHTNRVHVFLFAVRTMWACDSEGEPEAEIRRRYRLITSF